MEESNQTPEKSQKENSQNSGSHNQSIEGDNNRQIGKGGINLENVQAEKIDVQMGGEKTIIQTQVVHNHNYGAQDMASSRFANSSSGEVKVILEFVTHYQSAQLIIINEQLKPLKIIDISVHLFNRDVVPQNSIMEIDQELPLSIASSESEIIKLTDVLSHELFEIQFGEDDFEIFIYSLEGGKHSITKRRMRNGKFGGITDLK